MNSYINAQGFARVGVWSPHFIGAVLNIILDPFYFYTGYGNPGAAIATVISQFASRSLDRAGFLTSPKAILRIRVYPVCPCGKTIRDITTLGFVQFHDGNHQQYRY